MRRGKKTQMLMAIYSSHRMSLTRSIALLLLCSIVTLANAQSTCPVINDTTTTNINYTLTAPSNVTNGNTYQVTFSSSNAANGTVLLEVLSNNSTVGSWSSLPTGFSNCTVGIWSNFGSVNSSFTANWTAPPSLNSSVLFKALINDTTGTYTASKNGTFVAVPSTASTNTSTVTATIATNTNTTNGTATTTVTNKTTSGGPANHLTPMFFTLMETLFFLVVTSKFLY